MSRPAFVSFDVFDDLRRDAVRALLRRHGDWIQRSLWLALPASTALVDHLGTELGRVTTGPDHWLVHRPCLGCLSRLQWRPSATVMPSLGPTGATATTIVVGDDPLGDRHRHTASQETRPRCTTPVPPAGPRH